MDNTYYSGTISGVDDTGRHIIPYDDNEVETLKLIDKHGDTSKTDKQIHQGL